MEIGNARLSDGVRYLPLDDGFRLEIRPGRHWFLLLFLPFWLAGWTVSGIAAVAALLSGEGSLFLLVWLLGWLVAELFVLYAIAWNAAGKEVVELRNRVLLIKRDVLGWGPARRYQAEEVSDLRASGFFGGPSMYSWSHSMSYWGLAGGTVAFDYRDRTVRFGIQLEEREARDLVDRIASYFPR